ncbi:hypothetical protein PHAGE6E_131 [Staphylococcus phage 6ec]|uniref:Uncharacterized protein n=1 Tax=Staphylococcus phage 6ec TaxID=1500386 RepID=A0A060AKQ1_9CAUD|nr:hypothetical protein PHAGE6E_131 [Staphylococcus phage 6ec]AIA64157.1 hypothetical protein PHAGE6E_131 [Staphylococcus phage 6ec]
MKTITQTFNIYEITELEEEAKQEAIEQSRNQFQEMVSDFYYDEMLSTFKEVAKNLNIDIVSWSIGCFNPNIYINLDITDYMELSNTEKNKLVDKVNQFIKSDDDCPFTGVYTDCYFNDYFIKNNINKVTYNNLHKHITESFDWVLSKYINDIENNILNDDLMIEYSQDNNFMFLENGKIYQ